MMKIHDFDYPPKEQYTRLHKCKGRMLLDKYIQIKYPLFYNHLYQCYAKFGVKMNEMIYMFYNNMDEPQKCVICGKYTNFQNNSKGYLKHCCPTCAQLDIETREKCYNTCEEKYGVRVTTQSSIIKEKTKQTCLERYGVENPAQSRVIQEKTKQTCLERYGVENPRFIDDYKEKSKQTCLERYGSEIYQHSQQWKDKQKERQEKSKQTCLERYGVESPMLLDRVKQQVQKTCMERYGVPWNCMRNEAHNSRNSNSVYNMLFERILKQYNIEYTKEFPLEKRLYDFKVGNTLIEINPVATHNLNWSPFGENTIHKKYHIDKTNLAIKYGFKCIHIWEWDDFDKVAKMFIEKEHIYARKCIIKLVDKKTCDEFLNVNHLQNTCRGQQIRLGLYFNNVLIQVMTFGKPRYNKNFEYELIRLCTKQGFVVIGGVERLFKHFITINKPKSIISYCDNAKFDGVVYSKLGFKQEQVSEPSVHWCNIKSKQHLTDNTVRKYGVDKLLGTNFGKHTSNNQILLDYGFVQVTDCGQKTFTFVSV